MTDLEITAEQHAGYWHARSLEEAEAALACDDPLLAASHVELATHCLKRAQQGRSSVGRTPPPA